MLTLARLAFAAMLALLACRAGASEHRLDVAGSSLQVSIADAPGVGDRALLQWVERSARGVAAYLGRFPVPEVRLRVRVGGGSRIGHGVTHGGRSPSIRITVGREASERDLRRDWVLTHEMVHLGFPDLVSDDAWAEEGLATYAEPLARIRAGTFSEDGMWAGLIAGLPQGLPRRGDRGLHGTREWGRTYWGGALFWLLADVGIREATAGRHGLPDALAAILERGGDIRAGWTLSRTLETADGALSATVLLDLYRRLGTAPGAIDLPELFRRLGVSLSRGRVGYDDSAPLAGVRRAITAAGPAAPAASPAAGASGSALRGTR